MSIDTLAGGAAILSDAAEIPSYSAIRRERLWPFRLGEHPFFNLMNLCLAVAMF